MNINELKDKSVLKTYTYLGTDPEIFVFSGKKLLPAFEFLPAKTATYYQMTEAAYSQAKAFWDGFQAEWAFDRGFGCIVEVAQAMRGAMKLVYEAAKEKDAHARLTLKSVVKIPRELLKSVPEEYVTFGCMPSYNAYKDKGIHLDDPRQLSYRFAGGHIHLEYKNIQFKMFTPPMLVKALDKMLGVWAVGAAANFDDATRRKYYGLAGEFRVPQDEGEYRRLEYRTLSNFWLCHPAIMSVVMDIAKQAIRLEREGYMRLWTSTEEETREAINTCNVQLAREILNRNKELFMWALGQAGRIGTPDVMANSPKAIRWAHHVGMTGIESLIKDPTNLKKNWALDKEVYQFNFRGDYPELGFASLAEKAEDEV